MESEVTKATSRMCTAWAACSRAARYLVEHAPDGGARLVDGGHDGVADGGFAPQVLHHAQRRKGVQPGGGFVQEHHWRPAQHTGGDVEALPLAAAQATEGNATGQYAADLQQAPDLC